MSIGSPNIPDAQLPIPTLHLPFRMEEGNVARVGRSRVSLDVVIEQYESGMTPEAITQAYDTLELAEVHEAVAYYLRHRTEVQAYLKRREQDAAQLRVKIESERPRLTAEDLPTASAKRK